MRPDLLSHTRPNARTITAGLLRAGLLGAALLGAGTLVGCAAKQPTVGAPAPRQQMIFSGPETQTVLADPARARTRAIDKPAATVWNAVKQVYLEWEVPLTVENSAARQLGNGDFYRTRRFANKSMTELVSCGAGITGPNAASYRIYLSLLTTVVPNEGGGTTVSTTLVASARDMSGGAAADRLPCASTGLLERLLLDRASAIAVGAG